MLQVDLKVLEGRQQGKFIPLVVRQFLIGREQDCHLRPNSDLVSRHHCVFTLDDFTVRLRDLGSTNGTFVNDERIQGQVVLKPGDHVVVGKLSFEIVIRQTAEVAASNGREAGPETSVLNVDEPVSPIPGTKEMETSTSVSQTLEFPVVKPGDDTTIIPTFPPPEAMTQQMAPQPGYMAGAPYGAPVYGVPQGYPMPQGYGMPPGYAPQGYAPMAGYTQPGYAQPGYAQPGYMSQPGYPMPQQMMPGMAPGYAPQQPQASPEATPEMPDVTLPDPDSTGAKAFEPPPPPPPPVDGEAPVATQGKIPSDAAADIIRMHRLRRP
ncbi:MAG: FHA domain-containing protein [Planctomycetaceae bacterium]|nr:FHA domain-containing protein [Planctomycetaceae bacterium]